jgi:hypothetical protein
MPTGTRKPSPHESTGSAELDAMVERVAPSILELLADGVPRSKAVIAEALAVRHDKQDVVHAPIRLAVTGLGQGHPLLQRLHGRHAGADVRRRRAGAPDQAGRDGARLAPDGAGARHGAATAGAKRNERFPATRGRKRKAASVS